MINAVHVLLVELTNPALGAEGVGLAEGIAGPITRASLDAARS